MRLSPSRSPSRGCQQVTERSGRDVLRAIRRGIDSGQPGAQPEGRFSTVTDKFTSHGVTGPGIKDPLAGCRTGRVRGSSKACRNRPFRPIGTRAVGSHLAPTSRHERRESGITG